MTAIYEKADLGRGLSATVKLHDDRNVILLLTADGYDEPLSWGFPTVAAWRSFLKMCLRFDESLGVRP